MTFLTLPTLYPRRFLQTDTLIAGGLVVLQILFFFDASALFSFLTDDVKNVITLGLLTLIGALCFLKFQGRTVQSWDRRLLPLLLFVLSYVCSLLYQTETSLPQYYEGKINKLLIIILPTVLAVNVICWTPRLIERTFRFLSFALLAVTLDGAYQLLRGGSFMSRDESFGIDPISLGRSAGFCVLYAFLSLSFRRGASWKHLLLPALLLSVGFGVMFASGSRGPLIALGAALFSLFLWAGSLARRFRILLLALLTAALGGWTATALTQNGVASSARVLAFLQGDVNVDRSAQTRSFVYDDALRWIPQHPFGSGQAASDVYTSNSLRYPHNLLLEIQLEGGLICLLLLVAAVVTAYRNSARGKGDRASLLILTGLTYFLVNAMFSGDTSSNRLLFLLLALAAVMPPPVTEPREITSEATP